MNFRYTKNGLIENQETLGPKEIQAALMIVNSFMPRQRTCAPGCPSCFLARKPPIWAIKRIAEDKESGSLGGY